MRLNHRFRRLAFAQVLLGIVAFCIAEPNPGLLLVFGALSVMSWYLTEGPTGQPLPRWLINIASLLAVAWLMMDLFYRQSHVVIAMGHFTIALQVLLLYASKTNREYAQLLVLSLMTMIGASILSVSMLYGLLLAAYCGLGLVTLLHFHMKVTWDYVTDATKAAAPPRAGVLPPRPLMGRGYQWHFRFLTLVIAFVSASVAVAVFVATPRREERPVGAALQNPLVQKQTGFSQSVQLGSSPKDALSTEPVLNMSLSINGQPYGSDDQPILLRGASLDNYRTDTHTWTRGFEAGGLDSPVTLPPEGQWLEQAEKDHAQVDARVTLRQSGFRVLFTAQDVSFVKSQNFSSVTYNRVDQQLAAPEVPSSAIIYDIKWPVRSLNHDPSNLPRRTPTAAREAPPMPRGYALEWPLQRDRLQRYALNVLKQRELTRDPEQAPSADDARLADILAAHLRDHFEYSLENPAPPPGADPLIEFLFNHRKGHCELFAAAHAALCRSIGIPARLITGYRASEYNRIGGYYVVRQSNAHAWTEIYGGPTLGWLTLDATPPDEVAAEHSVERTWLTSLREVYEVIEYEWIRSVVAYDQRSRERVMNEIKASLGSKDDESTWLGQAWGFVANLRDVWELDRLNYTLIFFICIMIAIAVASLARTLLMRRRRLVALQLTALPRAQRRGLAARLKFYLTMLDLLERNGYIRPSWQSPFSFAQELAEANPMKFDPVVALTELFYEIRFGHRDLDEDRKARVKAHLKQLEGALSSR